MVFQCFEWIAHLVSLLPFNINKRGVVQQLPDGVIDEILSRIPAEQVVECRRVCRRWRLLTSSQYFIDLQLSRATTPSIFVYRKSDRTKGRDWLGFFVYDPTFKRRRKMKKLQLQPDFEMDLGKIHPYASCRGLILITDVFITMPHFYVFNPLTQDEVKISRPSEFGYVCGFFYHPLTGKYKILYFGHLNGCFSFFVYTLGIDFWRHVERPPFHYRPSLDPPAICNGALYWIPYSHYDDYNKIPPCSSGILVFDMNKEVFYTMPYPGDKCRYRNDHEHMSLLAEGEQLYFFYVNYHRNKFIGIWILEDHSTCVWLQKWKLSLNLIYQCYWEPQRTQKGYYLYKVRFVHIQDGQLWLDCAKGGLYLYRLGHNTLVKLEGVPPGTDGTTEHRSIVFTKSLVSLPMLICDRSRVEEVFRLYEKCL